MVQRAFVHATTAMLLVLLVHQSAIRCFSIFSGTSLPGVDGTKPTLSPEKAHYQSNGAAPTLQRLDLACFPGGSLNKAPGRGLTGAKPRMTFTTVPTSTFANLTCYLDLLH